MASPKLMKILLDVYDRVYIKRELGDNPKKLVIVDWIKNTYEISNNRADAMDLIMRSNKAINE